MTEFSAFDHACMAEALRLAERGLNTTQPNPRVGCVLVREGRIIGRGFHERAGGPHAEVVALRDAGDARGATAYVTLEPCAHHGRTGPCADALIQAGVVRVVAGCEDPFPAVAGAGLARLKAAGMAVSTGLMREAARALNAGFFSRIERGRPYVRVKLATSIDGRTALANGASRWITGEPARRDGHRFRARASALLTGAGTVLADDPELTVRYGIAHSAPIRAVADTRLRTPVSARLLQGAPLALIYCAPDADASRAAELRAAGAEVCGVPLHHGRIDPGAMLADLARRGVNELHVEAGAGLTGALFQAQMVDELLLYQSGAVLGADARPLLALTGLSDMAQVQRLQLADCRRIGDDWRLIFRT